MRKILMLFLLLLPASAAQAVLFDDGLMHVIDSTNSIPNDRFIVKDSAAGDPTSLTVTDAEVGTIFCGDCSYDSLVLDTSSLTMSGASFGYSLGIHDTATAQISDSFVPLVNGTGDSHVTITSGQFGQFPVFTPSDGTDYAAQFFGTSTGEIFDGVFDAYVVGWQDSHVMIHGGTFRELVFAEDNSLLSIHGGTFESTLHASLRGVAVFGGSILGGISANPNTQITLHGSSFNFPFGPIIPASGVLTGILADSTPLSVAFSQASSAVIELACPGVGSLLPTTPTLAADQDNYCEDWSGVMQPGDDLSRAFLKLADLSLADLSATLLVDADLKDSDLTGADLSGADVRGTILDCALYDEFTIFPSGNTYDLPPWGLDGDIEPWFAGMKPAPEPSFGLVLLFGAGGLAGLASRRR